MGFVHNRWYVAGWSSELSADQLLARKLLGQAVVIYRDSKGAPVALRDRCPHRFVPLHIGKVEGDNLRCGYHGLVFGPEGRCVENPHGAGAISSNMAVSRYPVREQDGLLWLWLGAEGGANEADIPRFPFLADRASYVTVAGHMPVQANYQLINDNLLDLSHTQFVHPIFTRQGEYQHVDAELRQEGEALTLTACLRDVSPYSFARFFTDLERVDNFRNTRWLAPSIIHLDFGVTPPGGSRREAVEFPSVHLLTPETEATTHYFWALSRNVRLDDAELSRRVTTAITTAFGLEDKPLIEAQQRELGAADLMTMKPVLLSTDAPAIRARRIIDSLMKKEASEATQPSPA